MPAHLLDATLTGNLLRTTWLKSYKGIDTYLQMKIETKKHAHLTVEKDLKVCFSDSEEFNALFP